MSTRESFLTWDFYGRRTDGSEDPWFMPEQGSPILSWQKELTGLMAVPDVVGLPEDRAANVLALAGLVVSKTGRDYDPRIPAGSALAADPARFCTPAATVDLWISLGSYDWSLNPGNGTHAKPFELATAGQLACLHLRPDLWCSDFVLADDLDMRHHAFGETLIAPDQNQADSEFQGTPFGGRLDGRGHAIRNLTLKTGPWSMYVGLIGHLEQTAEIRNLRLQDAHVTTGRNSYYVGILAGHSNATIIDCAVQGTLLAQGASLVGIVTGVNEGSFTRCQADGDLIARGGFIGGLAGVNMGQISLCAVKGTSEIQTTGDAGGVAGESSGGISNSYSSLSIVVPAMPSFTWYRVGGVVGSMTAGPTEERLGGGTMDHQVSITLQHKAGGFIRNCYATGRISGDSGQDSFSRIGGLVGYNPGNCSATGSVWDIDSTGARFSDAGSGLTTRQMTDPKTLAGFGFDFVNTWTICDGKDYPRLKWESVRCETAKLVPGLRDQETRIGQEKSR
jgi:hypothetical protein